jgi:hypothetical protein
MTPPETPQSPIGSVAILLSILVVLLTVLGLAQVDWAWLRTAPPAVPADLLLSDHAEAEQHQRHAYAIWTMDFQRDAFEWNLRSTRYLFWLSVVVSVSGIAFAFWQFVRAEQFDRARTEADEMEVKTQMASLSFKARSMAALVLFVSIVYLTLYAVFVYPIQIIDIAPGGLPEGAAETATDTAGGAQGGGASAAPQAELRDRPPPGTGVSTTQSDEGGTD